MGRSGFGSRLVGALVVAAAFVVAGPASAGAALTKPERKAVDIAGAEGASISTAAFAEVDFKGNYQEEQGTGGLKRARTTIELIPDQGETTVITDRGSSRRPKDARTGTPGHFELARVGRTISLLVEDLPAPAAQIRVTTSGPGGGTRLIRRGAFQETFGTFQSPIARLTTPEQTTTAIDFHEDEIARADKEIENLDRELDELNQAIGRAKRALDRADTKAEADKARERLEGLERTYKGLSGELRWLRLRNKSRVRWLKELEQHRQALIRQCNDGVDNGDPEDTIADHPADPGCVEPLDDDEKHNPVDVACPLDGDYFNFYIDVFTTADNTIVGYRLTKPDGSVIAAGDGTGPVGPTQVPESVCGGDTTTSISYGSGASAPQPPGSPPFSPPSGETGARFVVEVNNPAGGTPGASSATVIAALNTRGQP